jgi:hypothetical protein
VSERPRGAAGPPQALWCGRYFGGRGEKLHPHPSKIIDGATRWGACATKVVMPMQPRIPEGDFVRMGGTSARRMVVLAHEGGSVGRDGAPSMARMALFLLPPSLWKCADSVAHRCQSRCRRRESSAGWMNGCGR